MSSGAFLSHAAALHVVDGHLSGRECDLIAATAARLLPGYRVEIGPGDVSFAWCSAIPASKRDTPTFSFCRYGTAVMLLIKDSGDRKTVVTSASVQEAIDTMAAVCGNLDGKPPSLN